MTTALDFDTIAHNAIKWLLAATDWADVSSQKRKRQQEQSAQPTPSSGLITTPPTPTTNSGKPLERKFKSSLLPGFGREWQPKSQGLDFEGGREHLSKSLDTKEHKVKCEALENDYPISRRRNAHSKGPKSSHRNGKRVSWRQEKVVVLDDDDYLSCDDCHCQWNGDCPEHGPLQVILDSKVPMGEPNRARRTVPRQLVVLPSKIEGAGEGVWTREAIPRRTRLGPYEGDITPTSTESGYGWEVVRFGQSVHWVDAVDETTSNWVRFVNCARNQGEENLRAFQYKGRLYYRTVRDVPAHTELLVWYGDSYGEELGIDRDDFDRSLPDPRVLVGTFSCGACKLCFISPLLLNQHHRAGKCSARRRALNSSAEAVAVDPTRAPSEVAVKVPPEAQLELRPERKLSRIHIQHEGNSRIRYRCNVCDAFFKTFYKLERHHKQVHTDEKPFVCDTCGAAFSQKVNLRRHHLVHTDEKPFVCDTCGAAFNQESNLHRHHRVHTGDKPFVCSTCGAAFAQKANLKGHMHTHSGEKAFSCVQCGRRFAKSGLLRWHQLTHSEEQSHRCTTCGADFRYRSYLMKHMKCHPVCDECGEICMNRAHFFAHRGAHKSEERQAETLDKHKCTVCGEAFKKRSLLRVHCRTHAPEKYTCQFCGEVCNGFRELCSHRQKIHPGEKPYKCQVCYKGFDGRSKLRVHELVHSGEKPYKCEVCGLGFSQRCNMQKHMLIHESDRPFKCEVCGLGFRQKVNMRRHMLVVHHPDKPKPYKCDLCDKAFTFAPYLRKHAITHSSLRPYKCNVCSATFRNSSNLSHHMKIHTGEKPYKCGICGAAFTQSGNRKKHMMSVHTGGAPLQA